MESLKKESIQFDNSMFKERFQFILYINENIICQRYFKIKGFDSDSLQSEEFRNTMKECVNMIKDDLVSKSRIYLWYVNNHPMKLTGFANSADANYELLSILTNENIEGTVNVNGKEYNKTYMLLGETNAIDDEHPESEEFVFRFVFMVDDNSIYEEIWDGGDYPKYVRNSVDLTNSDVVYRGRDPRSLHFNLAIVRHLTYGRNDLVFHIIKKIHDVCSHTYSNKYEYTKKVTYKNNNEDVQPTTYYYSTYNRTYVNDWRKAVEQKTRQYENWVNNSFSQWDIERIDKRY